MRYIVLFMMFFSSYNLQAAKMIEVYDCKSAREYITIYEYLGKMDELAINDARRKEISSKVSAGCNNAAWRFINVFELLFIRSFLLQKRLIMDLNFQNQQTRKQKLS